ncbi:MAG: glycosyltransferase family A protein [Chloroherpetonaceae bacterium]|nr:glycosyltransferase family A protein [Chloroherpetonaceae bacterium]
MRSPVFSVGVPLYKSNRFLHIILDNIESILSSTSEPIEFIFSDRHCLDDCVEKLKSILIPHANDERTFKFISASDEVNWVENCNLLMRQAKGTYFMWMMHDDTFSGNYLNQLKLTLDQYPDALLAYSSRLNITDEGLPYDKFILMKPVEFTEKWSARNRLQMLYESNFGPSFRGLYRIKTVLKNHGTIRQNYENVLPEITWLFGLSALGRIVYSDKTYCVKRHYEGSVQANWEKTTRHALSWYFGMIFQIIYHPSNFIENLYLFWGISIWIIKRRVEKYSYIPFFSKINYSVKSIFRKSCGLEKSEILIFPEVHLRDFEKRQERIRFFQSKNNPLIIFE